MSDISDGAIIGSGIVKLVAQYGESSAPIIYEYVKRLADAVHGNCVKG